MGVLGRIQGAWTTLNHLGRGTPEDPVQYTREGNIRGLKVNYKTSSEFSKRGVTECDIPRGYQTCDARFKNICTDEHEEAHRIAGDYVGIPCALGVRPQSCMADDGTFATCEDGSTDIEHCLNDYYQIGGPVADDEGRCIIPNITHTDADPEIYAGTPFDKANFGLLSVAVGVYLVKTFVWDNLKKCCQSVQAYRASIRLNSTGYTELADAKRP